MLLLAPPAPPPPRQELVGPVLPGPALPRASQLPPWVSGGIRALLRDIPGAVVEVEDTMPAFLPKHAYAAHVLRGLARVRLGERWVPSPLPPTIMLPGMDISEISAGGNRVHKSYTLGGVGF